MTTGKNTKLGRPLSPKGKKRVRKALSLDPDVLDKAELSAGLRDISLLANVLAELKDSTANLERTVASLLPESAKATSPLHSLPTPPATKRGRGNKAN